jgi:predicted TIM-barrel fold metal-dependent hydrolase
MGAGIIDAHVHLGPPDLPGVGALHPLLERPSQLRLEALRQEMLSAGVDHVLAIGCRPRDEDPLGVNSLVQFAREVPGIYPVAVADPTGTDVERLQRVEAVLAAGRVRGFKAYLGYLHYPPTDPGYHPYYDLAARYGLPFIFHTGDTYSALAKLKYAHPLLVDDVAVEHPNVRFVLAHLGHPWLLEAAEVIYKNLNVWADLSGLAVGDSLAFASEERRDLLNDTAAGVARAFRYAERPTRFLYGSDWPLASMRAYRDWIASILPEFYHPLIFEENARALFRLDREPALLP